MDISSADLLLGISEFSIGLAGFSGIVAALAHRSGNWVQVDRYRIGNLLYSGLSPGFLAFFALGLNASDIEPDITWKFSAGTLALVLSYGMFVTVYGRKKLPDKERVLISIPVFYIQRMISLIALVFQLIAIFGLYSEYIFTIFYFGLVAQLFVATIQFVRIIFVRPKIDDS
ncbi:MAG: hypothetical protein KUG75_02530 [Pseudomonadales bacterium]|nr:hypothetical protein [Pseudomonadales bacterium]